MGISWVWESISSRHCLIPLPTLQSTLSDMDPNLSGLTTEGTTREEFLLRRQGRHVLYVHNYSAFFLSLLVNLSGYTTVMHHLIH